MGEIHDPAGHWRYAAAKRGRGICRSHLARSKIEMESAMATPHMLVRVSVQPKPNPASTARAAEWARDSRSARPRINSAFSAIHISFVKRCKNTGLLPTAGKTLERHHFPTCGSNPFNTWHLSRFGLVYILYPKYSDERQAMELQLVLTGTFLVGDDIPSAALPASSRADDRIPDCFTSPFCERLSMFKLCYGVLTVATIAAATLPASAQQPPAAAAAQSDSGQSKAPAGAYSYFVNLKDGDTVTSPFKVIFGLSPNMGIAPSGIEKENVGHHHVLVDTTLTPDEMTQPIMVDEQHIHFGKGQTETTLTLPPGKHTLQLVLGNWTHIPFNAPVQSEVITVTVKGEATAEPAK
jgi:hypothetical protein